MFFTLIGVVHPRQLGGSITVSAAPLPDIPKLREQLDEHSAQIKTLQEQITQSESNLAAQKEVTEAQVQSAVAEAIQGAKREHLELLAGDTGMDLDEMDTGKQLKCYFVSKENRLKGSHFDSYLLFCHLSHFT